MGCGASKAKASGKGEEFQARRGTLDEEGYSVVIAAAVKEAEQEKAAAAAAASEEQGAVELHTAP